MAELEAISLPAQNLAEGELSDLVRNLRSNVIWSAVFDLVGSVPNAISATDLLPYIERQLNASLEDVVEALSGLTKLELIAPSRDGYRKLHDEYRNPLILKGEATALAKDRVLQAMNIMSGDHPHYIKNSSLRLNSYQLYELMQELGHVVQKYMDQAENPQDPTEGAYEIFIGGTRVTNQPLKGGRA